jgi:hypothetical protein
MAISEKHLEARACKQEIDFILGDKEQQVERVVLDANRQIDLIQVIVLSSLPYI